MIPMISRYLSFTHGDWFTHLTRKYTWKPASIDFLLQRGYTTDFDNNQKHDKLYDKIHFELRGHDRAVLKSYITFVQV